MSVSEGDKDIARWLLGKRGVWALVIAGAVLVALSARLDNGRGERNASQKHNIVKQGDRILFTLGDREFNIPEGNFKGGGETGSGQLVQVSLWGLLPDFEGYDKAKNHDEFMGPSQGRGWGRYARIELYRREDRITVPEMVVRWARTESSSAISDRVGQYDELRYGLEYYRSDNRSKDIYLYREGDQAIMFITCPSQIRLKTIPAPSCLSYWDISPGTSYEIRYSMDYLPQWREIWVNTQQLVNGKK